MSCRVCARRAKSSVRTSCADVPERDSYPMSTPKPGCHWPGAVAAGGCAEALPATSQVSSPLLLAHRRPRPATQASSAANGRIFYGAAAAQS